jgi:hypothetical protein
MDDKVFQQLSIRFWKNPGLIIIVDILLVFSCGFNYLNYCFMSDFSVQILQSEGVPVP